MMTALQQSELNQFLSDVSKMLHYESAYLDSKKRTRDGCQQDKRNWLVYRRKVQAYLKKNAEEQIQVPLF